MSNIIIRITQNNYFHAILYITAGPWHSVVYTCDSDTKQRSYLVSC